MGIQPDGEDIRKATNWIVEENEYTKEKSLRELVEEACVKFDLSPLKAEFLIRHFHEEKK